MCKQVMKTPLKPLTPAASAATDKFLEHIVTCGHCQSFPRSLCQTGAVLQRKASLERMKQVLLADAKGDAESPPASEPTPAKKTEAPAAKKQPSSARVPPVANPVARR